MSEPLRVDRATDGRRSVQGSVPKDQHFPRPAGGGRWSLCEANFSRKIIKRIKSQRDFSQDYAYHLSLFGFIWIETKAVFESAYDFDYYVMFTQQINGKYQPMGFFSQVEIFKQASFTRIRFCKPVRISAAWEQPQRESLLYLHLSLVPQPRPVDHFDRFQLVVLFNFVTSENSKFFFKIILVKKKVRHFSGYTMTRWACLIHGPGIKTFKN